MPIRVYKIADIIGGTVVFSGARTFRLGDVGAILSNIDVEDDPDPNSAWKCELVLGKGSEDRRILIDLPPILSKSSPRDVPIFLPEGRPTPLAYFKDRLFMSERPPLSDAEREEFVLRVKKAVYDEETELSNLRAAVANLEAAIEFQKSGARRDPISEDVKLLVWARDGGQCVRCGSKQALHFDHIIPVAKGGGNSEANIQILCQVCNLLKSDKIAIT